MQDTFKANSAVIELRYYKNFLGYYPQTPLFPYEFRDSIIAMIMIEGNLNTEVQIHEHKFKFR